MPHRNDASSVNKRVARLSAMLLEHDLVTVPTPDEAKRLLDEHKLSLQARGGLPSTIEWEAKRLWPLCQDIGELKRALAYEHSPVRAGQLSALRGALSRLFTVAQEGEPVLEVGSTVLEAELDGLFTDEEDLVGSVPVAACIA